MKIIVFFIWYILGDIFHGWEFRWHDFCVGEKRQKAWAAPLCIFGIIWKERKQRSFENEKHSNQSLKAPFLAFFFCGLVKLYTDEDSMPLIDFEDWLGCHRGREKFFVLLFLVLPNGSRCIRFVYFSALFLLALFIIHSF